MTELESQQQTLLTQIAEGNEGARRDLRRLDGEMQEVRENEQAFAAAAADVTTRIGAAKEALTRAERQAAISALENQIALLAPLDNGVESALAALKERSAALFTAVTGVAEQLHAMDENRFDGRFGYNLTSAVREAIHHRFEEMGFPNAEKRASFLERTTHQLRSAIEQLKYESLQGQIVPGKKEKLYRTLWRVYGLRHLDLPPGSLIALREDEAAPLIEGGSLELVEQQSEVVRS